MKKGMVLCGCVFILTMSACSKIYGGGIDVGNAIGAGTDLYKAATLSDEEVRSMALKVAASEDSTNRVDPASGKYSRRLSKIVNRVRTYDGLKLNYKAYKSPEVNAFALADGSIRVYTGLMDIMSDDELLCIIGHEIGHVKFGHSKEKMRVAYGTSAARQGVAATSTVAGAIAASEIGALGEAVINAQFSQSEEKESDEYGLAMMKKLKRNPKACPAALRKLAKASGGSSGPSFLSSHPDPEDRASKLDSLIAAK